MLLVYGVYHVNQCTNGCRNFYKAIAIFVMNIEADNLFWLWQNQVSNWWRIWFGLIRVTTESIRIGCSHGLTYSVMCDRLNFCKVCRHCVRITANSASVLGTMPERDDWKEPTWKPESMDECYSSLSVYNDLLFCFSALMCYVYFHIWVE